MKAYEYLNQKEINKLRQDLMTDNNDLETQISTQVNDIINEERGNNLEENFRKTIENEFGWEASTISRSFLYRKIDVNANEYLICKYKYISLTVNKQIFFIKFNEINYSSEIYKNDFKKLNQKINDKPKVTDIDLGNYKIKFYPKNKIEIDGLYEINGIDFSLFPSDEFNIIYNNIKDNEKQSFELAAIEVKLNIKKMKELVNQLHKDFEVLGKITNRKIVFIGIVNSSSVSFNYNKCVEKFNCLILGIKNSIVYKRKMTAPIDWNLVTEFRAFKKVIEKKIKRINEDVSVLKEDVSVLKEDVKGLKKDNTVLKEDVKGLKKDVKTLQCMIYSIKNDINFIKNNMKLKGRDDSQNLLKKKRKRKRKNKNK